VIAQAQSGTGKTSMISLALCQMLDTSTREIQALAGTHAPRPISVNPNYSRPYCCRLSDPSSYHSARVHVSGPLQRCCRRRASWRCRRRRWRWRWATS
jgi:hypothetical protein